MARRLSRTSGLQSAGRLATSGNARSVCEALARSQSCRAEAAPGTSESSRSPCAICATAALCNIAVMNRA
eukprot:9471578-Pyramimonas_sp.AAC.1